MIEKIKLKFGSGQDVSPLEFKPKSLTIFVGPNNSGKSLFIRELNQFLINGSISGSKIIKTIFVTRFTEENVDLEIERVKNSYVIDKSSERISIGSNKVHYIDPQDLRKALITPSSYRGYLSQHFLRHQTLLLNAHSRVTLVNHKSGGKLQNPPSNSFEVLMKDENLRNEIRKIIFNAFGKYLVIDPTDLGKLNLNLSSISPQNIHQEIGLTPQAIEFHSKATPISQTSDGVKAFIGMLLEIKTGKPSILLVDEPEAFLPPPLAFKLGKEISLAMHHTNKRIFAATHSPHFVMGCIQSGIPIDIIRFTYKNEIATARILPNKDILTLMRNPLLRSIGVLSGLFYDFVIVTEGDADRAFYQEINERLLQFAPQKGIPNCLFLNAQNKQTIRKIIKPLRELGVPVAGIVDIDILKDGGKDWSEFLESAFIPPLTINSFKGLRTELFNQFKNTGKNMKKDGGIVILSPENRASAIKLLQDLQEYGLFVVPNGELESWLKHLGVGGHGPSWLIKVFEKMGEDPQNPNYVKPENGDVWDFIGQIQKWFLNSQKKGIPS